MPVEGRFLLDFVDELLSDFNLRVLELDPAEVEKFLKANRAEDDSDDDDDSEEGGEIEKAEQEFLLALRKQQDALEAEVSTVLCLMSPKFYIAAMKWLRLWPTRLCRGFATLIQNVFLLCRRRSCRKPIRLERKTRMR